MKYDLKKCINYLISLNNDEELKNIPGRYTIDQIKDKDMITIYKKYYMDSIQRKHTKEEKVNAFLHEQVSMKKAQELFELINFSTWDDSTRGMQNPTEKNL